MSDHGKPDKPGLWRDANEKTVVACMESGELRMRDPDTGMVLSGEWVERAAPFRQAEWKGPELIGAGFSAMPDTAGCWCDANGTLWLITGGDGIDGHIFRLKEPGREWECAPCFGITVRMLHEWGPWARCDFNPKDDEAVRFDWCKPWIADHGWDDDMSEPASSLLARIKEIRKSLPEENGLWRFEHAGSGVVFGDGGGKRLFLFDSGGGFLDGGLGPCTRLRLGIPVGSAPIPNLPGVWLDDEETTYNAGLAIQATPHEAPVLGVGPDSAIGVGRPQMDLVEDFIRNPPAGSVVRFETAGDGHEGHWGF